MCIALDTILADRQTHDARHKFTDVFHCLLDARSLATKEEKRSTKLSRLIAGHLTEIADSHKDCLETLPRHDSYSRHIIGMEDSWIGFICRWEQNITSTIHGHPSFAYYQVLAGHIKMEMFEPVNSTEARLVSTNNMSRGDSIFRKSREGQFDNLVHRVRTNNSSVFTLHLYSDNPAKGHVYRAV